MDKGQTCSCIIFYLYLEEENVRDTETFVCWVFIIETPLILNEFSAISIHQMWSFSGFQAPWLEPKTFLLIGRPAHFWVCVSLVSHVLDPYQFALFSEIQTRAVLDHCKDTYIKTTGKIMIAPRLGPRQGCKKHLNFIPGIVTAFQSSCGQNYIF